MSSRDVGNLFLELYENCLVIFIISARTRPGLQGPFSDHDFDFSKLELHCALTKLSGDQDSEKEIYVFSKTFKLYEAFTLYHMFGNKKSNHCCKATVIRE